MSSSQWRSSSIAAVTVFVTACLSNFSKMSSAFSVSLSTRRLPLWQAGSIGVLGLRQHYGMSDEGNVLDHGWPPRSEGAPSGFRFPRSQVGQGLGGRLSGRHRGDLSRERDLPSLPAHLPTKDGRASHLGHWVANVPVPADVMAAAFGAF